METTTVSPVSETVKAERELCAAIVKGTVKAADVQLRTADFSDGLCRTLFTACLSLEAAGKACDFVTVCEALPGQEGDVTDICLEEGFSRVLALQHADIIRCSRAARGRAVLSDGCSRRLSDPLSDVDSVWRRDARPA